jgi:hypothetical protein
MSEVIKEHKADVARYICHECNQECVWTKGAKRGTFDEKITCLTYDHTCQCPGVIHDLDKIYPIVNIKEEISPIILSH